MTVINEIQGETYKKLIEYAINNCEKFSLLFYHDQTSDINAQVESRIKEYEAAKININNITDKEEKFLIEEALEMRKYKSNRQKTLRKLKKYRLHKKYETMFSGFRNKKEIPYSTTYYFKLDKELLNFLLEKNNIYDWVFEKSLENLSFYIKNIPFITTVSHERLCWIECRNQEEYEYFKSLGIEFKEKEFKPSIYFQ